MSYERHHYSGHPVYKTWIAMKQRCYNRRHTGYSSYGGRGITVCERWINNFPAFFHDMGNRPDGFTIERINNNGMYEPSNCRWISRKDQLMNRRNTVMVTIEGKQYKAKFLADIAGMKTDTIISRAKTCQTLREVIDDRRRIFFDGLNSTNNRRSSTHCKRGHEFNEANTYWYKERRQCRVCMTANQRKSRHAKTSS